MLSLWKKNNDTNIYLFNNVYTVLIILKLWYCIVWELHKSTRCFILTVQAGSFFLTKIINLANLTIITPLVHMVSPHLSRTMRVDELGLGIC